MTVSVVIPAYNAAATIGAALKALSIQDYPHPIEIIVVDDGSSDATADVVARYSSVRYVRQENAGPAAARNHGARISTGEFICFTDSDCVPHANWVSGLLSGFSSPDIAVTAGSYGIANPGSLLASGIHAEILFRHAVLMPEFPRAFGSYNFCIRRSMFEQVGGFQETYRRASGEDNDLSYKVVKAGGRIHFLGQRVVVDHFHTSAPGRYLNEQFRHGYWRVKMYADHPEMIAGDDYTFWKDMIEVIWAAAVCAGALLLLCGIAVTPRMLALVVCGFLLFEIIFGCVMIRKIISGIFFGYVMFLRAFFRTFGLSTGIYYFLSQKIKKKFK